MSDNTNTKATRGPTVRKKDRPLCGAKMLGRTLRMRGEAKYSAATDATKPRRPSYEGVDLLGRRGDHGPRLSRVVIRQVEGLFFE